MAGKVICEIPLETVLGTGSLDVSESGTPGRYRLVSCADFIEAETLTILEYTDFPEVPCAALSYVWRGNSPDKNFDGRVFNVSIPQVESAEPGDPIGVKVVHEACVASRARGATHLWLDRLCIMQKSKDDKRWLGCMKFTDVVISVSSRPGASNLSCVLMRRPSGFAVAGHCKKPWRLRPSSYHDFPFWRKTRRVLSPNVGALARIMSEDLDQDMKDHSIWQSTLMRTSSRPVDMVFSIMGLFGVALDTSKFGKDDRVQATIALAQAIVEKGGRATWLAAAFRLPPSRQISTFPIFPRTSDCAEPTYFEAVDESWWKVQDGADGVEEETFAILLGYIVGYHPGSTPAGDTNNIRAAIIEKHAENRFHVRSYIMFSRTAKAWVQTWPERAFSVGGPAVDIGEDLGEELPVITVAKEQYLNNPQSKLSSTAPSLEEKFIRRARWAIPPKTLEQTHGSR
ncbi:hypothetical protein AAE478_005971 [Parahypoxylon ruwenzoriense]